MAKVTKKEKQKWEKDYKNYDLRCPTVDDTKYLTEKNQIMLGFLKNAGFDLNPKNCFQNQIIPNAKRKFEPDYRFEKEKIIIEYDGIQHYQELSEIKNDREKDNFYVKAGYEVIRIPFFIQPCTKTIKHYFEKPLKTFFNKNAKCTLQYPHGFIIYNATPPAYFCMLGLDRFITEFCEFPDTIKCDIIKSLKKLISLHINKEFVLPNQYEYLLNMNPNKLC